MKQKTGLGHSFGAIAAERGQHTEDYFEELIRSSLNAGKLPPWFRALHRTERNAKADRSGIDFIVHTDRGSIRINVKSSNTFANKFARKHPGSDIVVAVVNPMADRGAQLGDIITLVGRAYRAL